MPGNHADCMLTNNIYVCHYLTELDSNHIREMCSDACNNLVKHFNKPEKEVI